MSKRPRMQAHTGSDHLKLERTVGAEAFLMGFLALATMVGFDVLWVRGMR